MVTIKLNSGETKLSQVAFGCVIRIKGRLYLRTFNGVTELFKDFRFISYDKDKLSDGTPLAACTNCEVLGKLEVEDSNGD